MTLATAMTTKPVLLALIILSVLLTFVLLEYVKNVTTHMGHVHQAIHAPKVLVTARKIKSCFLGGAF